MYLLKDVINTMPLSGRLILGKTEDVVSAVGLCGKILVIAIEPDHLFSGINIKNVLDGADFNVDALSLDSCAGGGEALFSDYDCVVAVGGREICDLARVFCEDKRLIFVPTALDFYYAFSPLVSDTSTGLLKSRRAKLPDIVLFDVDLIKRLKLKHLADGLSTVASSVFWKFDVQAACAIDGKEQPDTGATDSALAQLKTLNDKPYETIIKCQIFLSNAVYNAPQLDFCADRYMAYALTKIKDLPAAESRFFSARYIIKFYEKVLSKDISNNLVAPDYNKSILSLADMFGISPATVYENFAPYDEEYCYNGLKAIYENGYYERAKKCAALIDGYQRAYDNIYKGRHKRMDVDKRTAVKAMALSAVTSDGFMKIFADSGITELIGN